MASATDDYEVSAAQAAEMRKAAAGQAYNVVIMREGYERWEESLLTDAEVILMVGAMRGEATLTDEHKADIRRRMDESIEWTPGLDVVDFFKAVSTGVSPAEGCLIGGTPKRISDTEVPA